MNSSLKNKWALVTGASRGVGQQIAIGLAQYGVNLVLHSSNIENQKSTVNLLKKYNVIIMNVAGSLESNEDITQFVTDSLIQKSRAGTALLLNISQLLVQPGTRVPSRAQVLR